MATPTSSVPRARAALFALLAADSTLSKVKALWGPLNPTDRYPHEWLMLARPNDGRTVESTQTPNIGNHSRDEEYTLFLTITCARGGYDAQTLDTRAYELLSALELALRADPQLSAYATDPIGQPFQVGGWSHEASNFPALEGGAASQIVVSIDCEARLRSS